MCRGATSFMGKWLVSTHISASSNKELHGKGCTPNSHGLEFIYHNSPIFINPYYLFAMTTSSLKIDDLLLFCCIYYNLFQLFVNTFLEKILFQLL